MCGLQIIIMFVYLFVCIKEFIENFMKMFTILIILLLMGTNSEIKNADLFFSKFDAGFNLAKAIFSTKKNNSNIVS